MGRIFIFISVICFLLAFVGAGFGVNGGHVAGSMGWNDMVALGLFFYAAAGLV